MDAAARGASLARRLRAALCQNSGLTYIHATVSRLSYELFIGLRYTYSKQRTRVISFISVVSVVCIALGIAALIIVLSVMNGFQREIRTRILGVASHVQLAGAGGMLSDWQRVAAEAARHDRVIAAAPYITAQGLFTHGSAVRGALVRGILPEQEERVAEFAAHMRSGRLESLKSGEYGVVLGIELARSLGATVGEKVVLVAPQGQVTP